MHVHDLTNFSTYPTIWPIATTARPGTPQFTQPFVWALRSSIQHDRAWGNYGRHFSSFVILVSDYLFQ
jgi:hypothetical protein